MRSNQRGNAKGRFAGPRAVAAGPPTVVPGRRARAKVLIMTVAGLLAAGFVVTAARDGRADTFYVNNQSPVSSSAGPGSLAAPYSTISAALAAHHAAGTIIVVLPGVYREQVTVPASGVQGNPIVLKAQAEPGLPVVVDGSDDFSDPGSWVSSGGDVWLASSVTWNPLQVFADDARLSISTAAPGSLPPRSFVYVAGSGLYVNAGGGNPGDHHATVGHRPYGFYVSGRSWVVIDGFTVTRSDNRGIQITNAASQVDVLRNVVSLSQRFGIQAVGSSALRIASNVVFDSGDHGISLTAGTTGSVIEDNESFRNVFPAQRQANGLYMFGCPNNLIQRNRFHDNQDTGLQLQSGSNNNLSIQNLSWNNGDHGFDHLLAVGNVHIGDVAYGNFRDGFSIEGNSTGQELHNCIAVNNGLTTNEFDLWVDAASSVGLISNDNLFWNSTSQSPVKYGTTLYAQVADYSSASGQDTRTIQADPRFVSPAQGDFHLLTGSPAIDNGDSGVPNWPTLDAEGHARVDDPATPNRGLGPVAYADRGALEYLSTTPGNQPPVARLTIVPSSGPAPLTVQADASRSFDPDGTIASYRFDFGDGTAVGPQSSPTATHVYATGSWTARMVVTDNDGASTSASATVNVTGGGTGPNLVGNPSFETDVSGWGPVGGATMRRVAGGFDGQYALELVSPSGTARPSTVFGVTDEPNGITSTGAGARYWVGAWVRSATGDGSCFLVVRELDSNQGRVWTTYSSGTRLSPSWRPLTLSVTTHAPGTTLDLQIVDARLRSDETFQVDAVSFRQRTGGIIAGPVDVASAVEPAPVEPAAAEGGTAGRVGVFPNPFRNDARLAFAISRPGRVNIGVFDGNGRAVRTLLDGATMTAGVHTLPLDAIGNDGSRLGTGLYFYRIRSAEGLQVGRFVVMR